MKWHRCVPAAVIASCAGIASADLNGFYQNPQTNSTDWRNAIANLGGFVDETVDFDAHQVGQLQNNFYFNSAGVTFNPVQNANQVQFGAGPGQGNEQNQNQGEGVHPESNFLFGGNGASDLLITFDEGVFGAGIFSIDKFSGGLITITAYDGPDGSGNNLGSFDSLGENFQRNRMYFMGVTSSEADIRSIRLVHNAGGGDTIGYDDLLIGRVPAPGSAALLGLGGLVAARRRR